jgi:integrase
LKQLCAKLKFANPRQYKLHTFRHAFASMCARNNTSYKYALQFMGHKNSEILDLYYTMYDDTAAEAIRTIDYGAAVSSVR